MKIDAVIAREINDTRGKPTVEVTLHALCIPGMHKSATASVPSGKSTGSHEAKELRDEDGSVKTAVANVNGEIARALCARAWNSPDEIDQALIALDGTPNKSRLGANAILGVSIAAQRLFAEEQGVPLWKAIAERAGTAPAAPRLYVNVLNGGAHAEFCLPFQEHLLVIDGSIHHALSVARSVTEVLGDKLKTFGEVRMGDEGGFAVSLPTLESPFELLSELIAPHTSTALAIDAAANELRDGDGYTLFGTHYTSAELAAKYRELAGRFAFHSIEDPFSEDADADFAALTAALSHETLVVGDDFTVTNPARIEHAIKERAVSAVLIKPNQIGSVMEAINAVKDTRAAGLEVIASHRSGETMDTFIADFAYGVGAHGIKAGGLAQKERMAKYDRLLEIEHEAQQV